MAQDTTRPVGDGIGIDLSGIDVAGAIFEAKGGLYGTPQDGVTTDPALLGAPGRDGTWVAGDGRTPDGTDPADTFDPGQIVDPLRDISFTTDPILQGNAPAPLLVEAETPNFANGGPDGAACEPIEVALVVAAVVAVGAVIAYNVSDGAKASIDKAWDDASGFFDKLFTGDDAGNAPAQPSLRPLQGDTRKPADFNRPADYFTNPDADQSQPADDGAVLRQAFGDLLGSGNPFGLALDVETFMKGGSVLDAMNGGKGAALADIMAGFSRFGIDATDGLTAGELGRMGEALGLGDLLGFLPLGGPDEADRLLLDATTVETLFAATDETILTLAHTDWW